MNPVKIIKNGIWDENPILVQCIGLCPTLAVSTSATNGVGMGIAATAVLIGSNVAISALRKLIPDEVRIPAFIVIIAGFVTVIQLLIAAYAPDLDQALGIFIPLIVVNCIILARAEAFAFKNGILASAFDGLGMGLGFTLALTAIGCVRELLGGGTIFNVSLTPAGFEPALLVILAPGGFITLGIFMALYRLFKTRHILKTANGPSAVPVYADGCAGCSMSGRCPGAGFGAPSPEKKED